MLPVEVLFEDFLILENAKNIEKIEEFKEGKFTVQDETAGLSSFVLAPKEGEIVLDACSAPGGKTTYLAELMHNKGKIVAWDIYEERLKQVEQNAKRLGIDIIQTEVHDATKLKEEYVEKVQQLQCLIGIKTHTALSLIVETSDFNRFKKGNMYSAYLGLIPGDDSSGGHENKVGITKAGNSHLRRLLVEAAQGYTRGRVGFKSKDLKSRQEKCSSEVVAYADRANERLRRKYYRMTLRGKKYNVAKTAIARELACFVWGIMTDHIDLCS